jgi:hypothetical protein
MLQVPTNVLAATSKSNVAISILQGYVTEVFPATMSVDVTIPSASMIIYGVSLSMPSISKDSRSIAMPKVGSPITVCTTSVGGTPVALGAYYTPSSETTNSNGMNEVVYPGEHLQTAGLSYMKQTRDGNMILGSKITTGTSFLNSGKTYSNSLEKHDIALNFDAHDGFSTVDITGATNRLYTHSKKTYYQELEKPCNVYASEEASAHKNEILQDATDIMELINGSGTSPGYIKSVVALQDIFAAYNSVTAAEKIAAIEILMGNYILPPKGPQMDVMIGAVSDDELNIPQNLAKSSQGIDLISRLTIRGDDGSVKGKIDIDKVGNVDFDTASLLYKGVPIGDSPAETITTIGTLINGATEKTTPVDADMIGLMDSTGSNILKKFSIASLKTFLGTVFAALSHTHGSITNTGAIGSTSGRVVVTGTSGVLTTAAENTAFNKNYEITATNITMNGTQAVGSADTIARGDHVHPVDTSRAASSHTHTAANITDITNGDAAITGTLASGAIYMEW